MKKMLMIALVLSLALVGVAQADIEISGHVVTVWSDAQHDEQINATGVNNAISLALGSGPVAGLAGTLSTGNVATGQATAAAADILAVAEIELDIEADITDNISARIDIEMNDGTIGAGASVFDVEAAYIKLVQPFDVPFDVIVGKFVAPIGVEPQEQIDRKLITQSLVDRLIPNTLTGIAVTGTVSAIDYVVFYVNDLAPGDNDRNANTDGSNAMGARLATSPLEGLDIGITYAQESLNDVRNSNAGDADYRIIDLDAVYANGPWEIRGEYLAAEEDDTIVYAVGTQGDADVDAYSIQVAYDVDEQINVAVRYANSDPNTNMSPYDRLGALGTLSQLEASVVSIGASYAFSENAIFKIEYSDIQSDKVSTAAGGSSTEVYDPNDNLIAAELTVAF